MPAALQGEGSFHAYLLAQEDYREQVASYAFLPGQKANFDLHYSGAFRAALETLGLRPYSHQAAAFNALEAGQHVVLATSTASGKSLSYQLPCLQALQDGGYGLLLFPTKALAHDQLEKLRALAQRWQLAEKIASYDGDTPRARRQLVREDAQLILTNPDMLHYGILPRHRSWANVLGNLRYLVIDEMHVYRGVLGTHAANILRRLLRLCAHYGSAPQLIAASATIGNPAEHAQNLTGAAFTAITRDGGQQAAREVIFWQPPKLPGEAGEEGRRRSVNAEAAALAAHFVRAGLKSIIFCNSRKRAELVQRYASGLLPDALKGDIASYRAGYNAKDRRQLEADFKAGKLKVLCATSALELGVDIGGVDAVVMAGYPGSVSAFWQRAGRAGRGESRALALFIAGDDPLDSYYLSHPENILEALPERAVADANNSILHPKHLACAAFELPLRGDETMTQKDDLSSLPEFYNSRGLWYFAGRYPHGRLSIRGQGGERLLIRDNHGKTLGETELNRALQELHPGAVYLHQGENYLVRNLDIAGREVRLLPHLEDNYTQVRSETDIRIVRRDAQWGKVALGQVEVTTRVTSYVRKRLFSDAVLDERALDLPEISYPTQALWFACSDVLAGMTPAEVPAALHALEHTLIGLLPAFVLCERADVGGVSYPLYPATGKPTVFIYDGYPGGVGYAFAAASLFQAWLTAAKDLLATCPCKGGCPRCVLSPKCGNGNMFLNKQAAKKLAVNLLKAGNLAAPKLDA